MHALVELENNVSFNASKLHFSLTKIWYIFVFLPLLNTLMPIGNDLLLWSSCNLIIWRQDILYFHPYPLLFGSAKTSVIKVNPSVSRTIVMPWTLASSEDNSKMFSVMQNTTSANCIGCFSTSSVLIIPWFYLWQNQSIKCKDQIERLEDDTSRLQSKLVEEDRKYRQIQSQLSRALESQADVNRKDIEQAQTIANLVSLPIL